VEKHVEELDGVRAKTLRNSLRIEELKNEIEFQQAKLAEDRAVAERLDEDEVDDSYLKLTQRELSKAENRQRDLTRAADMVLEDLQRVITKHSEEYTEELLDRLTVEDERIASLQAEIEEIMQHRTWLNGLVEWVSGEKSVAHFSPQQDIRTSNYPRNFEDRLISAIPAGSIT